MQRFDDFPVMDFSFWSFIKFISERLKYTDQNRGIVKSYTMDEILGLCHKFNIPINHRLIATAAAYCDMRANLLNNAASMFMDMTMAEYEFLKWRQIYKQERLTCKLPFNKQKGVMHKPAFFTAMINILTERTIREITGCRNGVCFDDDPRTLLNVRDARGNIVGASSRRFDGVYPDTMYPKIVWEIKEYYYTTTFGSRIADGIYETLLDGFELNEIHSRTEQKIFHILFIDAYDTWWGKGKSYLCRIIDALNMGLVDEVIIGKEIFLRWPMLLRQLVP